MDQGKILLFHVASSKEKKIKGICRRLGIGLVTIPGRSYGQKLGFLAGITGFKRENMIYQGEDFSGEMLVFSGITSEKMDEFLAAYREMKLEPIDRKAVVTPHNIFWTPVELYQELEQEHQSFQKIH